MDGQLPLPDASKSFFFPVALWRRAAVVEVEVSVQGAMAGTMPVDY
jgi:hypothetical protein